MFQQESAEETIMQNEVWLMIYWFVMHILELITDRSLKELL